MKLGFKHEATGTLTVFEVAINRIIAVSTMSSGQIRYATLDGLKFTASGILKEFPDLGGKPFNEMKEIALKRFKKKIKAMKTEEELVNYLIKDLSNHGYTLYLKQKKGFRPTRIK